MIPAVLKINYKAVEIAVGVLLIALGILVLSEALRLGPGYGPSGPAPGFFPFYLAVCLFIGVVGVLVTAFRNPDSRPFFEDSREITDLLKVGIPIAIAVLVLPWAGMYVTAGVYLALFMAWHGRFRWYYALAGGILLPLIMWLTLRQAFNIPMPMSVFYTKGILPF